VKVDYHIFKSMLNSYIGLHMDRARRPTYFNISEAYPALDAVTNAYPAIRKEFEQIVAEGLSLPQYHEVDSGERAISSTTPKRWNVFLLECLGCKVEANRMRCPETCRALASVPNMIQAFFSILDPGKKRELLRRTYEALAPAPHAAFIIYQVTNELRQHATLFDRVESEYFLQNIPPMFITVFHKAQTRNGHARLVPTPATKKIPASRTA